MIKKIFIILLCINLVGCGGFTYRAGLKFNKSVGAESGGGNPGFTMDVLKLNNKEVVGFDRPMGKCGGGMIWFVAVIIPVPVWIHLNSCTKEFSIGVSSSKVSNLQLKYNGDVYDAFDTVEKLTDSRGYVHGKQYKFKIESFWKFRMADDKALILTGEDGFTQELPVKWGVMTYYNWAFP